MTAAPSHADMRPLVQDLLRLGMAGAAGYANRQVSRIQLEYIVNPFGRQPPHILVFPDGRAEPMTPFQLPVPGYGADVLAVELLGVPGSPPTSAQLETLRAFGDEVRSLLSGQMAFSGNHNLVYIATAAFAVPEAEEVPEEPEAAEDDAGHVESETTYIDAESDVGADEPEAGEESGTEDMEGEGAVEETENASVEAGFAPSPAFMRHERLSISTAVPPPAEPIVFEIKPAKVQDIFDILGTPPERRAPLAPGSIFNTFKPGRGEIPTEIRVLFTAPGTREILRLVVIPSHDSFKPEPDDPVEFTLEKLRKADNRLGMGEFRAHYLLAKDGTLIPARSIEAVGNCWPGKNEKSLQIVLAGNGKSPTPEQRRTLFEYAHVMRRHYERPLQASVRDIVYAEGLLGVDPNGVMQASLANPSLIDAPLPQPAAKPARAV